MTESTEVTIISTPEGSITINPKTVEDDRKRSEIILMNARSVIVKDTPSYTACLVALKEDKEELKNLEVKRKKKTDPFTEIVRVWRAFYGEPISNVEKAIEIRGKVATDWNTKQKALIEAENKRLQAEADKKAKALEERARKAAEAGNAEKAEALKQEALMKKTLVPTVSQDQVKVSGLTAPTPEYSAYVDDKDKKIFVEWCLKSENLHYLIISESELKVTAKQAKGTRTIPGVTFTDKSKIKGCR